MGRTAGLKADPSFLKFPHEILNEETIKENMTRTMERIYSVLLDMRQTVDGYITISINHLAKKTRCCAKSICNALNALSAMGIVQKKEKASRTEINSLRVFSPVPLKGKKKSIQPELPALPAEPEQIQPEPEKTKKKKYGNYGRVRLTDEEYSSLIADFGEEKVSEYIQKADDYSKDKNRWYNNNAQTIRQWLEEDKDKPSKNNARRSSYTPTKMRPGKTYYNFHGKTYRDLIEELPEEQRAKYYQKVFPRQLDEVATMPLDRLLEINEYEIVANELQDNWCPAPEPEPEPEKEVVPPPPSSYEMTDEEISTILDKLDCNIIYNKKLHPLFYCPPGELLDLARKWKAYKGL